MKPIKLQEVLSVIGGNIVQGHINSTITNVTTKIKHVREHTLFFNLKKESLPEHVTLSLPTNIIVVDNLRFVTKFAENTTVVKVRNIKRSFRKFLSYYRNLFTCPVIGITGSSGKSTTKKMITHILSNEHNVKSTIQNYNLFRSNASVLMKFDEETDFGVFELGVGYRGHLKLCCKYFGPFTAVITTIGTDHISRYRSKEDYIQEKAEILNGLGKKNAVILNADCENTRKIDLSSITNKIIYFGFSEKANYRATHVQFSTNGMKFVLHHDQKNYDIFIPGYGIHNVHNALCAIATTHYHGICIEKAIKQLETFKHMPRHLEVSEGIHGSTIVDDTWNTNTTSVEAALKVLRHISNGKKTIAILGKISELGSEEENEHRKIGKMILEHQIETLITIGKTASIIANEALKQGMKQENIITCNHPSEVLSLVSEFANSDSIILVKTSMRDSYKDFVKKLKNN